MLNSLIRGFFMKEESPTQVLEVKSDNYVSRPIHCRKECMLLYGPKPSAEDKNSKDGSYEIVLYKPFTETQHQMYSLFRSPHLEPAEERFIVYNEIIPNYINHTKECSTHSLQKLCDTLAEHRGWNIGHLAAHFGLIDMFNEPDVQSCVNKTDPATGALPLMVAIKTANTRMVQSLLSLKSAVDVVDYEGNNVFHYAAGSNKEIIALLATHAPSQLNVYNKAGYTPLHMACLANAPEIVRAFMLAGADVNLTAGLQVQMATRIPAIVADVVKDNEPKLYQLDMKNGGTPLHWAISKDVIEVLVDKKCDINALNFEGKTALHVMVLRGRFECAVALLFNGADHSIGDNDGNTPLHLSVKQTNISLVQALIVFGSNMEARNKKGYTARHLVPAEMSNSHYDMILYMLHAAGAKRCPLSMSGCKDGCSFRGHYNGVPPPPIARAPTRDLISHLLSVTTMDKASTLPPDEKRGRVLCLDGGGIRGLILVQILLALEEIVGKPIIHCFDYVSGTSTGGILALALSTGTNLRECQRLYFKMKEYAFVGMRPYPAEPLENILKECMGTETVMADISEPKLMIMAVVADRKPVDLHIFRNYQSPQEILDEHNGMPSPVHEAADKSTVVSLPPAPLPAEQLVWQAARASGAAPSYFRATGRYLDGGLISNNPTLDVLTELAELRSALVATGQHEEAKKTHLKVVVSCGTGLIPVTTQKDIDLFKPGSLLDTARVAWGLSAIGNLLVDQATQSDGRIVDRARAWCSSLGVPYFRFNPQISKDIAMNERNDEILVNMLWETAAYMCEKRDKLIELATLLTDDK